MKKWATFALIGFICSTMILAFQNFATYQGEPQAVLKELLAPHIAPVNHSKIWPKKGYGSFNVDPSSVQWLNGTSIVRYVWTGFKYAFKDGGKLPADFFSAETPYVDISGIVQMRFLKLNGYSAPRGEDYPSKGRGYFTTIDRKLYTFKYDGTSGSLSVSDVVLLSDMVNPVSLHLVTLDDRQMAAARTRGVSIPYVSVATEYGSLFAVRGSTSGYDQASLAMITPWLNVDPVMEEPKAMAFWDGSNFKARICSLNRDRKFFCSGISLYQVNITINSTSSGSTVTVSPTSMQILPGATQVGTNICYVAPRMFGGRFCDGSEVKLEVSAVPYSRLYYSGSSTIAYSTEYKQYPQGLASYGANVTVDPSDTSYVQSPYVPKNLLFSSNQSYPTPAPTPYPTPAPTPYATPTPTPYATPYPTPTPYATPYPTPAPRPWSPYERINEQ